MELISLPSITIGLLFGWVYTLWLLRKGNKEKYMAVDLIIVEEILVHEAIPYSVMKTDFPTLEDMWKYGQEHKKGGVELFSQRKI